MNRNALYSTNASLYGDTNTTQQQQQPTQQQPTQQQEQQPTQHSVIRPPIRNAYDSQQLYDDAVQIGINFAITHSIPYIDHY
jgi:hypothetical protein